MPMTDIAAFIIHFCFVQLFLLVFINILGQIWDF